MSDFEPVLDITPPSNTQPQLPVDIQKTQTYFGDLQKTQQRRDDLLDEKVRLESQILEAQLRFRQNKGKENRQTPKHLPRFEIPAYSVEAQLLGVFPLLDWEQRHDYIKWFLPKLQFENIQFESSGSGWRYLFSAISHHLFRVPIIFTVNERDLIVQLEADLADLELLCPEFCDFAKVVYIPKMQINALLWGISSVAVAVHAKVECFSSLRQLEGFVSPRTSDSMPNNNRLIIAATKSRSSMQFARGDGSHQLILHWEIVLINKATADCGAKITAAVHEVLSGKEVGNVQKLYDLLQLQGLLISQAVRLMVEQLLK